MTLRARLTTYYTIFFAVAMLLLGVGLYLLVRELLLDSVVDELRVGSSLALQAYAIDSQIVTDPRGVQVVQLRPPDLRTIEAPALYVQIAADDGSVLARSTSLGSDTLPLQETAREAVLAGREVTTIEQIGATRVLSLMVPLRVDDNTVGVVQVAQSLRQIDRALNALLGALIIGGLVALLAAARGSLWLAEAALQPIDQVSATAAGILRAEDLHQRVPDVPAHDELGRLTRTINDLLARMDRVFTAQQRFTADVAHELRTPLTAMRGNLEILRRGAANDPAMLDESLADMEREVQRLTRMANDLLLLAQADAGVPLRMTTVQLDEVLVEVYRDLRSLADARLRLDLRDQLAVHADRDRIKQAVINLVANALQHTPADRGVTLRLQRGDESALISVQDTGPGIPQEQQAVLFDRFFRGDTARPRGGAGLGLAIARWVADAHGGAISLDSQPGRGSTFTIALPLQPTAAESEHTAPIQP